MDTATAYLLILTALAYIIRVLHYNKPTFQESLSSRNWADHWLWLWLARQVLPILSYSTELSMDSFFATHHVIVRWWSFYSIYSLCALAFSFWRRPWQTKKTRGDYYWVVQFFTSLCSAEWREEVSLFKSRIVWCLRLLQVLVKYTRRSNTSNGPSPASNAVHAWTCPESSITRLQTR
jgi:hypothetical protein